MEIWLHLFLTSALDGRQPSPPDPELFTTGKGKSGFPLMES